MAEVTGSPLLESTVVESAAGPTIQSIPLELCILILSNLEIKEVKQFSLCSKSCRAASLPVLYRRLNLSCVNGTDEETEHPPSPMPHLEKIRAAFMNSDGSLHNIQNVVRHVTIDSQNLIGIDNIVTYYRGWVSLLPLFPALNSLKISYASPSARSKPFPDPEFDTRLFNASCSALMETCPAYPTLKRLHIKTSTYYFDDDPKEDDFFSAENKEFLGLSSGGSVLNYSSPDTILYPQALEEAYFDLAFRSRGGLYETPGAAIDSIQFIGASTKTLKKFGIWLDLHNALNQKIFPQDMDLTHITDLGLSLDFFNNKTYIDEIEERIPNVENLNLYLDNDSEGGFWEEEAMKSYGTVVGAWAKTLRKLRLPWFTERGELEKEYNRTIRIDSWIQTYQPSKLRKVVLVRQIPGDYFEAVDCLITRIGTAPELTWSEVYLVDKLPLDGL